VGITLLVCLFLEYNQSKIATDTNKYLNNLTELDLANNHLRDLSKLSNLPNLQKVSFLGIALPSQYWTKFSEWKSLCLLDKDNSEIRRISADLYLRKELSIQNDSPDYLAAQNPQSSSRLLSELEKNIGKVTGKQYI
jgi:Leucine-rich repeat (LRR) protein